MKKLLIRSISIAVVASLSLSVISCSSNDSSSVAPSQATSVTTTVAPTPTPVPACPDQAVIVGGDVVFGLMFDDFYQVNYANGDSIELEYNYQPRDVNIAVEEWSSSDESVATVSNSGVVTPVGMGECEITLHVTDGLSDGAYASINVTVQDGENLIEIQELPSYDELRANLESLYGADNISVYENNFSNLTEFTYTNPELPYVFCYNSSDDFYWDYPYETLVQGEYSGQGECIRYIVCRNDDYVLIIDERGGIQLRTDEYLLSIYAHSNGYEEAIDIAESLGIHIPTDSLDLTVLDR